MVHHRPIYWGHRLSLPFKYYFTYEQKLFHPVLSLSVCSNPSSFSLMINAGKYAINFGDYGVSIGFGF